MEIETDLVIATIASEYVETAMRQTSQRSSIVSGVSRFKECYPRPVFFVDAMHPLPTMDCIATSMPSS